LGHFTQRCIRRFILASCGTSVPTIVTVRSSLAHDAMNIHSHVLPSAYRVALGWAIFTQRCIRRFHPRILLPSVGPFFAQRCIRRFHPRILWHECTHHSHRAEFTCTYVAVKIHAHVLPSAYRVALGWAVFYIVMYKEVSSSHPVARVYPP
jgi:hypothetical protein